MFSVWTEFGKLECMVSSIPHNKLDHNLASLFGREEKF